MFERTQIIDDEGEPMKVYHGSTASVAFDHFDVSFLGTATDEHTCGDDDFMKICKFGFCFTSDRSVAEDVYAAGGTVIEAILNIENPFVSTYNDFTAWIDHDGVEAVKDCLAEDGNDGLMLDNGDYFEYIPLTTEQIQIMK